MPNLLPNTLDVNIVRLFKALFDQAPGYTYLTAYRAAGQEAAARGQDPVIAVSTQLNAQFATLNAMDWASLIATNLHMTGQVFTVARDFLVIQQNLFGGTTQASLTKWRSENLAGLLLGYANNYESDGLFGANAAYFNRSIQTSFQYSINPANTSIDPDVLRLADEPNTAPVAANDTASATEGGAMVAGSLVLNDTDAQNDALTYSLAPTQAPVPGLTLASNGGYTFDPTNPAYDRIANGATEQIVVNVRVSDGELTSNSTLTITVTGRNDLPTANAVVASGSEDGTINITPSVTDADVGETFTYIAATQPLHGTVVFNATLGQFVYTPAANYNGSDSFAYTVRDAAGAASTNFVTLSVAAVNDAPVAAAVSGAGPEDSAGIAVTPQSTDVDGNDPVSYSVVTQPANGTVSFNGTNFVYVPNGNFNGTNTFTYRATDAGGAFTEATATVTVTPVNDAPVANSGTATTTEDNAVSGTVTASDIDANDTRTFALNTQAANGTVTINATTGAYTYTPNDNFNGTDSFTFRVTDGGNPALSSTATVSVNVTAVNDAPVAADLLVAGFEDQPTSGQVGAVDVDGDTLIFAIQDQPANGTVTMNADGTFTYTPDSNYFGSDSFSYVVRDRVTDGLTDTGTVTLDIAAVADVLTTGVDNIVGSARTDVVIGNQATLNAGDSISGGGSDDDTPDGDTVIVNIENLTAARNFASFVLSGVETFQVTNDGTQGASFDMSSSTAVQTLRSTNSTSGTAFNFANTTPDSDADGFDEVDLQVLNLTEGVSVALDVRNDDASGLDEVNLNLTDSDDDGTDADHISITNGATSAGDVDVDDNDINEATPSGVELVNIVTADQNGAESSGSVRVNDLNTPGTTRINIDTDAGLYLGEDDNGDGTYDDMNGEIIEPLSSTVSTINASASTGPVALSTAANAGNVTITGGSGDDRFELAGGNDSIDAGAGNDSVYSGAGNDSILGGAGDDRLRAESGNNTVDGGTGDDGISAGGGNDVLTGGEGNDSIAAGDGTNVVDGGAGNDAITVGAGPDTVEAGDGNDVVDFSGNGSDVIRGGAGNDTFNGGASLQSNYSEFWHVANFTIYDEVDGGDGTDTLNLTGDGDTTDNSGLGRGNDFDSVRNVELLNLGGEDWNVQVTDGSWFDTDTTLTTLNFAGITGRVLFDGNDDGNLTADGPSPEPGSLTASDEGFLSRAISVWGSGGNDTIHTGIGGDSIRGAGGSDEIRTNAGDDSVSAGMGSDNINTGAGNDAVIFGDGINGGAQVNGRDYNGADAGTLEATDTVAGGDGNDTIYVVIQDTFLTSPDVTTAATLDAGISGIETLKVVDGDGLADGHAVTVTLNVGYAQTLLTIDGGELDGDEPLTVNAALNADAENLNIIGGAGNDLFQMGEFENGAGSVNTINGGDGTDEIEARGVTDADFVSVTNVEVLDLTKTDNDSAVLAALAQAAGIVRVIDDAGNDTINASAYTAGIQVDINGGVDSVITGTGDDTVNDAGATNDTISTGAGNDTVNSNFDTGSDMIDVGAGNDLVNGLGGSDTVMGGDGNDTLVGFGDQVDETDVMNGGAGSDTLQLSDAQGDVTAIIALPNVTFVENVVAVDSDTDGIGNVANDFRIKFVAGSVATITTVNISGMGFGGNAFGTGGDSLIVDLSDIGDKDYEFNVTGGLGNDTVTGSGLPENLNFQAGGGDDWLNADATDLGTTLTLNGGAGVDTINMLSGELTDDSFDDITNVEVLTANGTGAVPGTFDGEDDPDVTFGVALDVQLGAQADAALDETTLGYVSITGTAFDDEVLLDAAFDDEVRMTMNEGDEDSLNAGASSSRVVVTGTIDSIDEDDTLIGGTGGNDAMWLTGEDDEDADLDNVRGFENIVILEGGEDGDGDAELNFFDGNFTGTVGNTITVNASALNDTTNEDGSDGEGSLIVNAGGITSGNFSITSGTGADSITTGGGNDTINAGPDNGDEIASETIDSGAGNDVVTSASGSDWINAGIGNDLVNAGDGNNTVTGGTGNDTISTGGGADSVEGGDGNDTLTLGGGNDTAFGGAGTDSISAGSGNDQVRGDAGADTIDAGDGNDTVIGGAGADSLTGGGGSDRFVYELRSDSNGQLANIDTITDYTSGTDVIDFRLVGLDPAVLSAYNITGKVINFGGNGVNFGDAQAGTFRGDNIVDVVFQVDERVLWVDLNDDGTLDNNDLRIRLSNVTSLTDADVGDDLVMGTFLVPNGSSNALAGNPGSIANDHYTAADGGGVTTLDGAAGNDTLVGGTGPDSLIGGSGMDSLAGNGGADTLNGGTGNDTLTGGAGADAFVVDSGTDVITDYNPGEGDTLVVSAGATAVINGTSGDDTIDAGTGVTNGGTVIVNGNGGADSITGGGGMDQLNGGDGNDTINGGGGADMLAGEGGDDSLTGGAGADTMMGGIGNDTLVGKSDDALLDGGAGTDTLDTDFNDSSDAQIVGIEIVTMSGTELILDQQTEAFTINGSGGNDTIVSGSGADTILSGAGNDSVDGGGGADSIDGGAGVDTLAGGAGAGDILMGGADQDFLRGQSDDALLDGGDAIDDRLLVTSNFNDTSDGQIINTEYVHIEVTAGTSLDLASQTESLTIEGNTGNDTITAGQGADTVLAQAGDDVIDASGGDDVVNGQGGADMIGGGDGMDDLYGDTGNDTLNGGGGADELYGEDDDDLLIGDDNDTLFNGGDGTDTLQTDGSFDDTADGQIVFVEAVSMSSSGTLTLTDQTEGFTITGSGGADTITGAQGADTVNAGGGNDSVLGGTGVDLINGDGGNDTLDGEAGADLLFGGAGNDLLRGLTEDASLVGGDGTDTLQTDGTFDDDNDGQVTTVENVTISAAGTLNLASQTEAFTITGSTGDDTIVSGAGADSISGGDGADSITGGAGNDTLNGGAGNDAYVVDAGTDTIVMPNWVAGSDTLTVNASATASIVGTSGDDTIDMSTATNGGTIVVAANGGADTITGSAGNDSIIGGTGADSVTTGAGADTVVLDMAGSTADTVADFTVASDILGVGQTGALQTVTNDGATDLAVNATSGHVVVLAAPTQVVAGGELADVANNGDVEVLIAGAIENVRPVGSTFAAGNTFTVVLSDGTDSGVYKVTVNVLDGNLGTEDFSVQLVGLLTGVDNTELATLTDANFS